MQPGQKVVVEAFGENPLDAIAHHLKLVDQLPPNPAELGPTDVLVAVKRAAVGWVDLLMTSGQYQHMPKPPYCPGLEYSGLVTHVGPDVRSFRPGDRVLSDGFFTGPRSLGPYQRWGGFAHYAVAPEKGLLRLPEGWSFAQGCNLLGNYETAYYCLVTCGRLQAGETIVIHGASGATGLAAVHIAKRLGATVIAT
ncbi:MAG: alcohol dehydrogenase catalytic domain-containing protein, partial [Nannocystaceae bacterium]